MPTEIAACSVGDLSPGYQPFTTPITNGLGAGPTLDFAIGHGICELLQRDGNGIGFRAMDRGIALEWGEGRGEGPADPRTRALLDRLAALNIDVIPKFASDEFGVAGVYCVGGERDASAPFPIMITAAGEAASVDREQALRKALFEFAAARVRKRFSHAPLAEIEAIAPPGYVERFRGYHSLAGEESRALRAMTEPGARRTPPPCAVIWRRRCCPAGPPSGLTNCRPGMAHSPARRSWLNSPGGSRRPEWKSCSSTSRPRVRAMCMW